MTRALDFTIHRSHVRLLVGHCCATESWAVYSQLCASVTRQCELVLDKSQ